MATTLPVGVSNAAALPFDPGRIAQHAATARAGLPTDSGEFLIDTTPSGYTVTTRGGPAGYPAVAFGDGIYLVCWKTLVGTDTIFGARVSASGVLLDSLGFVVCPTGDYYQKCAVAFGDSNFLVVWEHTSWSIRAARVSRGGVVLDPGGFNIADRSTILRFPDVAFNGSCWLVVWQESQTNPRGWQVWGSRVTLAGALLDTSGFLIAHDTTRSILEHGCRSPAACADGNQWFVAWEDKLHGYWGIACARVESSGAVIDTAGIFLTGEGDECSQAAATSDGSSYLVVWRAGSEASADIAGRRVTHGGVVLDREPIAVSSGPLIQEQPAVSFNGASYVVTWQDGRNGYYDIYAARVAPTGEVLDPQGVPVCTADSSQEVPAVACAGDSGGLIAWLDRRTGQNNPAVRAIRIDSLCHPTGPEMAPGGALVRTFANQNYPAVAFDGENYLVAWEDERAGANNRDVYGALLSNSGQLLEPGVFRVAVASNLQQAPAVAFGDSVYLVVWEDTRVPYNNYDIYGARVSRDGRVLDPAGIPIMYQYNYSQRIPTVAFDGTNFLTAWQTDGVAALQGKFVNPAGQVLDSAPLSVPSPEVATHPTTAFGDSAYLVAWGPKYATRINCIGGRPDTSLVEFGNGALPAMTFDGTNYCIVWQASQARSIYATRISQTGIVLDPGGVCVSSAAGQRGNADIEYGVNNYLAAWEDTRSGGVDILGAWMDPSLGRMDTVSVSRRPGNKYRPAIARGGGNQLLVVYSCTTTVVNGRPASGNHIWGRFVADPGPLPPSPPTLVRPSDGQVLHTLPVTLEVRALQPPIDSFDFLVLYEGETLWRNTVTAQCCTVPEAVLINGATHRWQSRAHDSRGWGHWSAQWRFTLDLQVGVVEQDTKHLLVAATASVVLRRSGQARLFVTGDSSDVSVDVLDVTGKHVRRLRFESGRAVWDMRDGTGREVASGIYYARAAGRGCPVVRKFVLVD
jgi:hypothetical protein